MSARFSAGLAGSGDDDTARTCLQKGMVINPNGIDVNFFYAGFLIDKGDYLTAKEFLRKARQVPERAQRVLADQGRQQEIQEKLSLLAEQLAAKSEQDSFFN